MNDAAVREPVTGIPVTGLIEGFYGPPWSWADRERAVRFLADHGANTYLYAPKNDPLHRDRWREPYLPEEWRHFADLVGVCAEVGVDFWFGVSPLGLRVVGGDDLDLLMAKFDAAAAVGVRNFCVLVDDMPEEFAVSADADLFPTLAAAHIHLVEWVRTGLAERSPDRRLWFVPLHYHGDPGRPYVQEIGAGIHPDVAILWTGPEVCSERITHEHGKTVSTALQRPVLYWDNHPVNDGGMRNDPHLGPLRGRDPELAETAVGILANVAIEPESSLIAVATFAEFARDPASYDPDAAWWRALRAVTGDEGDAEAVAVLADLARRSPLQRADALANDLAGPLGTLRDAWPDPQQRATAIDDARSALTGVAAACRRLTGPLTNTRLARDLSPWTGKLVRQVTTALDALDILTTVMARPGTDVAQRRRQVVDLMTEARRTPHWVAGDQLEEFSRWCLREASTLADALFTDGGEV